MQLAELVEKLRKKGVTPKACIYARFSSENQNEGSIDAQIRAINEFAKANNITIVNSFIDRARSATNDQREEFQKLMLASASGEFHFVIVHKLDRFARNVADSERYRNLLLHNGVLLVSTIENYDQDTPEGFFMGGISALMAEMYSRNLSREVKKGQRENALKGKHNGGKPPLGYDVNHETGLLVINEVEAAAVKEIFTAAAKLDTYDTIAETLNTKGYKTKRGYLFSKRSIYEILRNPKYTGLYFYNRIASPLPGQKISSHRHNNFEDMITIEGGVPAIISKEQFNAVQVIMDSRKQTHSNTKRVYQLAGKTFCGLCGSPYCGCTTIKPKTTYISYRCNAPSRANGHPCKNKGVNAKLLENKILSMISDFLFDESTIPTIIEKYSIALKERMKNQTKDLATMKKQVATIDKKLKNILSAIESSGGNSLIIQRLSELENEKAELQVIIESLSTDVEHQKIDQDKIVSLFNTAKGMLLDGSLEDSRKLVELFIDKITINEETIKVNFNTKAFILADDACEISEEFSRDLVRIYHKK